MKVPCVLIVENSRLKLEWEEHSNCCTVLEYLLLERLRRLENEPCLYELLQEVAGPPSFEGEHPSAFLAQFVPVSFGFPSICLIPHIAHDSYHTAGHLVMFKE